MSKTQTGGVILISLLALVFSDVAMAQLIPGAEDLDETIEPVANTLLDITELKAYEVNPETTRDLLGLLPDETRTVTVTTEFGQAFDELILIIFGLENDIRPEYVEFLEDLEITMFGVDDDDILSVGISPYHENQLEDIREQLKIMYPNVKIDLYITEGVVDTAAYSKSSNPNAPIPNGGGNSINDVINITDQLYRVSIVLLLLNGMILQMI